MLELIETGLIVRQGCCHTVGVLKQPDCGLGLDFSFVPRPLPPSFPGPPLFVWILTVFMYTIIHGSRRVVKNGRALEHSSCE